MKGNPTPEHFVDPGSSSLLDGTGSQSTLPKSVSGGTGGGGETLCHQPFGASLEPVLRSVCGGRLSKISWFRTDWQRGGALTGYASYVCDDGIERLAVVKLPVPPRERFWLTYLQKMPNVVPHLWAHGESLSGYDMAWLVMERLTHGPLGSAWHGNQFDLIIEAVGRFYRAADEVPIQSPAAEKDWHAIYDLARKGVQRHALVDEQRWNKLLKKTHRKLKEWLKIWHERAVDKRCHGDLHLANAMTRLPPPQGPALLLDFAMTGPGHWVEDAVYFEHLYWSHRDKLGDRRLCRQMAHERKRHGLKVDDDWSRLAQVKRALLAMSTPAQRDLASDPHHAQAALQLLEAEVG